MRGTHIIRVSDNRVSYHLKIRRNLTVIRGDSAAGKTTLLEMLDTYVKLGEESGILVECDVPVDVYMTDDRRKDWRRRLAEAEGSIIFIEEMNTFVRTEEFAKFVSGSGSYFVFITRWNLKNLPYSVEEIYRLTEKGRYPGMHQIYNSMEQIYFEDSALFDNHAGEEPESTDIKSVVTEDSGSGFDFYSAVGRKAGLQYESVNGNAGIEKYMRRNSAKPALYIADGAAFGAYMDACMQYMRYYGSCIRLGRGTVARDDLPSEPGEGIRIPTHPPKSLSFCACACYTSERIKSFRKG